MTGRAPVVKLRLETMEAKKASHFWRKHNSLCSLPSSRHGENVTQHLDKQIPSHFWRKHNSLCSLPSSRHGENVTQHIDKHIPSHFYGAEKACNTAIQNHYALDVNQLKQRPVNTQALSKFIICAVQKYNCFIFYLKKIFLTGVRVLLLTCKHHNAIKPLL